MISAAFHKESYKIIRITIGNNYKQCVKPNPVNRTFSLENENSVAFKTDL